MSKSSSNSIHDYLKTKQSYVFKVIPNINEEAKYSSSKKPKTTNNSSIEDSITKKISGEREYDYIFRF